MVYVFIYVYDNSTFKNISVTVGHLSIFPPSSLVSLDLLLDSLHCLHLKCCLGRGAADREVTVPKGRVRGGLVQTTRLYLPHSLT